MRCSVRKRGVTHTTKSTENQSCLHEDACADDRFQRSHYKCTQGIKETSFKLRSTVATMIMPL
jgi:hypothetical protein